MDTGIVTTLVASLVRSYLGSSVSRDHLASLGSTASKMWANAKNAQVQSAAEEGFRSKIQTIQSAEKEYDASIVEQKDLHKLSEYLVREIRRVAEEAVTMKDQVLIDNVF